MSGCGDPNCSGCNEAAVLARSLAGEDRSIPVSKQIVGFWHCGKCLDDKPSNVSPEKWARLNFGFTPLGIQVWCVRHEKNVIHIDFQGHRLGANIATEPASRLPT